MVSVNTDGDASAMEIVGIHFEDYIVYLFLTENSESALEITMLNVKDSVQEDSYLKANQTRCLVHTLPSVTYNQCFADIWLRRYVSTAMIWC